MPRNVLTTQSVPGGTDLALMARIEDVNGELITRSAVDSIAYIVVDRDEAETLASGTFAITTVSDVLVQDDRSWTVDSADRPGEDGRYGRNFKAILPAASNTAANSGKRVQIEVTLTLTSGRIIKLLYRTFTEKAYA